MRMQVSVIVVCLSIAALAGCTQRDASVSAMPTTDELPKLTYLEPLIPASIAVEGRDQNAALVRLVPDFEEPELTAEERAALGQDGPEYKFLLYGSPPFGPTVGPWYGGVATQIGGMGGPRLGRTRATSTAGVARTCTGAATIGIEPVGSYVAGAERNRKPVGRSARRGGVEVGEDQPSRVADHHTHRNH